MTFISIMNYNYFKFIFFLIIIVSCQTSRNTNKEIKDLETDVYSNVPSQPDLSNSLQPKWDNKEIIKEKIVDDMEPLDKWIGRAFIPGNEITLREDASVDFALSDQVFERAHSIKLKTPTRRPEPMQPKQRMWDWIFLTRFFNQEDFSEYTRISVKIFPDCPGHKKIHLFMISQNGDNVPDKYLREGLHTVMLENNKWNNVVFEVPHLPHDKVKGISFVYRQQGNEIVQVRTGAFASDTLNWRQIKLTEKNISISLPGSMQKEAQINL